MKLGRDDHARAARVASRRAKHRNARASFAGLATVTTLAVAGAACSNTGASPTNGVVNAVGAESQYANVLSQIGGRYVKVTAVMSNPDTDPHSFEASPQVAAEVSSAEFVIQNGLGYDSFMNKIEAAAPSSHRKVIDVQSLLGLPDSTANPHLWYKPTTMPVVAHAIAADLAALEPAHAAVFEKNARELIASLEPWYKALAALRAAFKNAPVAVTEPVSDYMLQAAGILIRTPWSLQEDVMNGVDLSPQDVSFEESLLSHHEVKAFVYNEQVTDSVTQSFLADAKQAGVPVVAVYETMPTPGYDYQTWMLAEVNALKRALAARTSTERL